MQYGVDHISAGDTLYVRDGTYHETLEVTVNGTAVNPILIISYPTEIAIIDGEYTLPGINYLSCLVKIWGDYVTLQNIPITQSDGTLILLAGSHDSGINIIGSHCYETGFTLASDYGVLDGCVMTYNGEGYGINGQPTWGSAINAVEAHPNMVMRNCTSCYNMGEGFGVYGTSGTCTLEDSFSYNNQSPQIYIGGSGGIVQRCLVYCDENDIYPPSYGICLESEKLEDTLVGTVVINNLCYGNFLNFVVASDVETAEDWLVANNTFVNTQKTQAQINSGYNMSIYLWPTLVTFNGDSFFENNTVLEEDVRQVPINASLTNPHVGFTFDYNCWNTLPTAAAQGAHDVVGDPDLARTDDIDNPLWYKLLITSPCIDAGVAIGAVTDDYWETPRDDPPCIGAHEYVGAPPLASSYGPSVWMDE
jgi:hypothetical protein